MLKRKDGRWQEQIKLPGMDKPKYFYGKTQREVKQKMAAWNKEQTEEKELAVLFETVADEWDNWHTEQVGWGTAQNYLKPLAEAKDYFSGRNIGEIYADEITSFLESVAKRGYKKQTVQTRKSMMRMIWDYAISRRILKYNAARDAKLPKGLESTVREAPEDAQMEKIRAGFDFPFGLFACFQCYAGMRRGELLALTWEDIDFDKNVIHVNKSIAFIGNNPHVKVPKTERGKRDIVLLDVLKKRLPRGRKGLVFPDTDGKHFRCSRFRSRWAAWCKAVGLNANNVKTEVTTHQLRHAYASLLYEAGVGVKDAQDLMGHANIQTTLNVYTHISKGKKARTAETLNEFICQNSVETEKEQENQGELLDSPSDARN